MSDDEIMARGIDCLFDNLGFIDAQKFIVMINRRKEDYTEWRREHLFEDMTDEELKADILKYAKEHNV